MRKKKIIGIILAAALVAGGLGGFAYANAGTVNEVSPSFFTHWCYDVSGDSFTNGEVTGWKEWHTCIHNDPDGTGAPVSALALSLSSELEFEDIGPEPTTMGPPTYEWFFGDAPEGAGGEGFGVEVGHRPVTFTPGFDASRSADKTNFLQSEGTQTQTLTITMTPRQMVEHFSINVDIWENDVVNAVITSPTSGEGINLDPDGHYLDIDPTGLELNITYTYYVTIEVTPKVPEVEFMPSVLIWLQETNLASGNTSGSSVSYPADGVGTWTWSADGSYVWDWAESLRRGVKWGGYSTEMGNRVDARFHTDWSYSSLEDTFTNDEVSGTRAWFALVDNTPDDTHEPINEVTLTLDSELEFDWVDEAYLTQMGPSTYRWFFDNVAEGSWAGVGVGFVSPDLFPVSFTPGFDASRSADITEFTEPGIQTLTITVTPREVTEGLGISVGVNADENDLVNPVITAVTNGDEFEFDLSPDGHRLHLWLGSPELNKTYTFYVTIEVTPKVPKVEFMPFVDVGCFQDLTSGTTSGSSVSRPAGAPLDEVGTWTCSAEGNYAWRWEEGLHRSVKWHPCSRDLSNKVTATSRCFWAYDVPGDTFNNDEVTGVKSWQAFTVNERDATGAPVTALQVSLDSDFEFDYISREPDIMGPPSYVWSLGDVAEESSAEVFVVSLTTSSHFTPGFDAYCSADNTVFPAPGTQRVTITLTPRDTTERFHLHVGAWEDDLVNPVIISVTSEDDIYSNLSPDGHWLDINPGGLELGTTWTCTVTIDVTPKVPQVEFMPFVDLSWDEGIDSGIITEGSVSYRAGDAEDPIGTWTWSADGSYVWHWEEVLCRSVRWVPCSTEIVNIPPVAQASVDPYLAPVDSVFTFDGSASYDEDGTIVSYDWDFGDGSSDSGVLVTHIYSAPGLYDIVLTVTDDMEAESTDSVMAVVYDPEAGFVTGGGWIYSDAGADRMNPSAEGKATFGFVSKYKRGATEPTGQTEFRFKAGDLNFHSTEYAWLVVNQAGTNAQFKGTGTINGTGEYKFMLWAGDDDPDTFRIRIWEEDEYGNEVERYDNGFDQTIAGGSIVIHTKK